jgi:3-hydroxyisobutyrate dehydrogenase-like beta-hydroxyacid dehydrogenase
MSARAPAARSTAPIGVVGLGLVGHALASRLLDADIDVLGFDRSAETSRRWSDRGGTLAASLPDLGQRCECVVLAVFDTPGVLDVVEAAQGLGLGPQPGSGAVVAQGVTQAVTRAVIDCSTGDPEALQALAGRLAARGVQFIEAPLSGSSAQIAAGSATMLLGGEAAALAQRASVLEALCPQRIHVGAAGTGARAKLATNLVLGLNRAALAEGMVFAERLGIAPAAFLQLVLATPARSDAAIAKGELMVRESFAPAQSRITQHLKDLRLMHAAASAAGQRLPLAEAHTALLEAAVRAGDGELDNAAVLRQLRRERTGPR